MPHPQFPAHARSYEIMDNTSLEAQLTGSSSLRVVSNKTYDRLELEVYAVRGLVVRSGFHVISNPLLKPVGHHAVGCL